jgi:hypothetical protein
VMSTAGTQHLSVTEFQEWLAAAQLGERCVYTKGALADPYRLPDGAP